MTSGPDNRLEELHAAIEARLKQVCCDWPLDRFHEMVRGLACITLKYERQLLPYDASGTDELIRQMKALRQRSSDFRREVREFHDLGVTR